MRREVWVECLTISILVSYTNSLERQPLLDGKVDNQTEKFKKNNGDQVTSG